MTSPSPTPHPPPEKNATCFFFPSRPTADAPAPAAPSLPDFSSIPAPASDPASFSCLLAPWLLPSPPASTRSASSLTLLTVVCFRFSYQRTTRGIPVTLFSSDFYYLIYTYCRISRSTPQSFLRNQPNITSISFLPWLMYAFPIDIRISAFDRGCAHSLTWRGKQTVFHKILSLSHILFRPDGARL